MATGHERSAIDVSVTPSDEHNQALLRTVHPPEWVNPEPASRYNLVVIGAGTAGLVTAIGAANLGAKVALIERDFMGSTRRIRPGAGHRLGRWVIVERDLYADYQRLFGSEPPRIAGVAVMTDTDNTGENAAAYYGDIVLRAGQG